jgi:Helix-turn-helix domain
MSRPAARAAPGLVTLEGVYSEVVAVHEQLDRIERLLLPAAAPRPWLTTEEASALVGRSPQAVTGWCRSFHIGTRVRGRWRVDRGHLRRLLIDRLVRITCRPAFVNLECIEPVKSA